MREEGSLAFLALMFLRQNSSSFPSNTWLSAGPHRPGLGAMQARSLPGWNRSSGRLLTVAFFFLSGYFFCIFFDGFLFRLSSSSASARPPPCPQRECRVGLVPLSLLCAVNQHKALLPQGLGRGRFVGSGAENIHDLVWRVQRWEPRKFLRSSLKAGCLLPGAQGLCVCSGDQCRCWQRGVPFVFFW